MWMCVCLCRAPQCLMVLPPAEPLSAEVRLASIFVLAEVFKNASAPAGAGASTVSSQSGGAGGIAELWEPHIVNFITAACAGQGERPMDQLQRVRSLHIVVVDWRL